LVDGVYTGTFPLGDQDGQFDATVTAADAAGNTDTTGSETRIQTSIQASGQRALIETGDGTFIELNLSTSVDSGLASLTSSDTPLAELGDQLSGDQFIEGELGDSLSSNLTEATIGIPESEITVPPGTSKENIQIRRFNETTNEFVVVGETTVAERTIDGTTRTYFLLTVDHFSTYGGFQQDLEDPSVDSVQLSTPGTKTGDRTFDYDTSEVTTQVTYSDDVSGVNASATTVKLDGTPVSELSGATADVTSTDATVTATGLVGSGDHTVTVEVVDEVGNTTTNQTTFTVAQDTTPPTVTSTDLPATLSYGTTSETVTVDYTDTESGVDTSSVTVTVGGTTLSDSQTTVDDGTVTFTVADLSAGESRDVTVDVDDQASTDNTATFTDTISVQADDDHPRVTGVQFTPTPDTGSSFGPDTDQVTVDLSVTDDTSGVDPANVTVAFGEQGTSLADVTSTAVVTDSAVSYTGTDLVNGTTYELQVTLEDEEGNTATETRTFEIQPDQTAPTVTGTTVENAAGEEPSFDNGVSSVDLQLSLADNLDAVAPGRITQPE